MNRLKKNITVRYFSVDAPKSFFEGFNSVFASNKNESSCARVVSVRHKKHLIKIVDEFRVARIAAYCVVAVKERNTWQVKANSTGKISGIATNQGIIGDSYFYFVIPSKKILIGFTTGPGGSLKSVGASMLEQFSSDRNKKIKVNLIPKKSEFSALKALPSYSSLHFKINSSSLIDVADDAPQLIKDLSVAPYIENNMQLSLDFELDRESGGGITKESVLEIVNFLSEHDGCTVLKVKGVEVDGSPIHLDFGNAFYNFKTDIVTRSKYVDEKTAIDVLRRALLEYFRSPIN